MKFNFEVLTEGEVRLARDIIKERIAYNVNTIRQLKKANPNEVPEIDSDFSVERDRRMKEMLDEAKKYQDTLIKFDNEYLEYLTSELKELPLQEVEIVDDEDERQPWKN